MVLEHKDVKRNVQNIGSPSRDTDYEEGKKDEK